MSRERGKISPARQDWIIVINNPSDADRSVLLEVCKDGNSYGLEYAVFCDERAPTTGTPHLQGFVMFSRSIRRNAIVSRLRLRHADLTACTWGVILGGQVSTPERVDAYTRKHGLVLCEFGRIPNRLKTRDTARDPGSASSDGVSQGGRTDFAEALTMFRAGCSFESVCAAFPSMAFRYLSNMRKLFESCRGGTSTHDPRIGIVILFGESGTGKTSLAASLFPDSYWVSAPNKAGGPVWFDDRRDERTIVFDEFTGWLDIATLLSATSGVPYRVQYKGGSSVLHGVSRFVLISNVPPDEWWPEVPGSQMQAFWNRVTDYLHFYRIQGHIVVEDEFAKIPRDNTDHKEVRKAVETARSILGRREGGDSRKRPGVYLDSSTPPTDEDPEGSGDEP